MIVCQTKVIHFKRLADHLVELIFGIQKCDFKLSELSALLKCKKPCTMCKAFHSCDRAKEQAKLAKTTVGELAP